MLLLCANLRLQTYDLVVVLNHGRAAAFEIEHLQRGTHLLSRRRIGGQALSLPPLTLSVTRDRLYHDCSVSWLHAWTVSLIGGCIKMREIFSAARQGTEKPP
ncbi:hypothetical protein ACFXTN_027392 [Malus domestica]